MDEITLWDEMNAREKWDRDFETRKPANDADRAILAQDLEAEDKRRNVWNEKHEKKHEGGKESSSDLSTAISGSTREESVKIRSVPSSSRSEEEGKVKKDDGADGFIKKFRKFRLRRTKIETHTT